jgi:hypothetical protein
MNKKTAPLFASHCLIAGTFVALLPSGLGIPQQPTMEPFQGNLIEQRAPEFETSSSESTAVTFFSRQISHVSSTYSTSVSSSYI